MKTTILVLLAVVVIGGGIYYFKTRQPAASTAPEQSNNYVVTGSNIQTNTSVSQTAGGNCGSVASQGDTTMTPQEQASASCMAKAISQCSSASLNLTGIQMSVAPASGGQCRINWDTPGDPTHPHISCLTAAETLAKEYATIKSSPSAAISFLGELLAITSAANPQANLVYTNEPMTCQK